ncbi:MAG TPA: hypothetical protein VH592_08145 [Gemmataceae bacterium]|jgi:CRISPR-associated protein Csx14
MTSLEPSIRINVDVTNPGQFFACCGLLELADRLWPGAEGWFQEQIFCLASQGRLPQIIKELKESELFISTKEGEPSIHPAKLEKFNLKLNWWIRDDWPRFKERPKKDRVGLMKTNLKFWAGNQSSGLILRNLQKAMRLPTSHHEADYFEPTEFISSRFGIDAGPAWTALDVGFSINEHPNVSVKASAAVELLAAIGLQRCRPIIHSIGIDYSTWSIPLSPAVVPAAICGEIMGVSCRTYRSRIIDRGSYAAVSHSFPLRGDSYA